MNKSPLIIVGMHRSGTSLLTSWINELGINIGDRLMGKGIANIKGHFEDLDFHDLHESIFKRHQITYGALKGDLNFKLTDIDKKEIKKLITSKVNANTLWGWKDPRTCLFLDYYSNILPDANYLIIYRDCHSVVQSLLRRDLKNFDLGMKNSGLQNLIKFKFLKKIYHLRIIKSNKDHYIKSWIHYTNKIKGLVESIDKSKYMVLDINALKNNDEEIFHTLRNWNYKIDYVPFSDVYDSKLFNVKKDINTTNCSNESLEMDTYFTSLVQK